MHPNFLSSLEGRWEGFCKKGQLLSFQKGQVLFYESHYPYGLFVLMKGRVSFSREGKPSGDDHKRPFSKGAALGLEALTQGDSYCCTCTAREDCQVLFISKALLDLL